MTEGFKFTVNTIDKNCRARTGVIKTPHGNIKTPIFIPVATKATVKALSFKNLEELNCEAILSNTYHLHLRPGEDLINDFGDLHGFMGWDKPIVTDSGGFQAFSLGFAIEHGVGKIATIFPDDHGENKSKKKPKQKLAKVDDDGVTFMSHIDGKMMRLDPEISMEIQEKLGADIIFAFDECTSPFNDYEYTKKALLRTHRWAERCKKAHKKKDQALFGIIQGGIYEDLRKESAKFISDLDFPGFGIGGSLGNSKKDMYQILDWVIPLLPDSKPRHLLGIGAIEDLFCAVEKGIDMFDCVLPTRIARSGHLFIAPPYGNKENKFRINIENAKFRTDKQPIDADCGCYTCRKHTRGYLSHLFRSKELLYYELATIHNVNFVLRLVEKIRDSIEKGTFQELKKEWLGE